MVDVLKWAVPLAIGVIALAQPWLIALWRKLFLQGIIEMHETGTIEVGYSSFGATLGLQGTNQAIHQDQFVRSIDVNIVKAKDRSQHRFEWGAFRTQKFSTAGTREAEIELPAGFMLTTAQPRRYNIQFFDVTLQDEMRPHIEGVKTAWQDALKESGIYKMLEADDTGYATSLLGSTVIDQTQQAVTVLYAKFSTSEVHVKAYTGLDRLCYWEPGRYSMKVSISTARPDRTFERTWEFELTESECASIRLNTTLLVQAAAGRGSGQFQFAYPKYQTPK